MTDNKDSESFLVVVQIRVPADKQQALLDGIDAELHRWMRERPGFVRAALLSGIDGQHVQVSLDFDSRAHAVEHMASSDAQKLLAVVRSCGVQESNSMIYRLRRLIG